MVEEQKLTEEKTDEKELQEIVPEAASSEDFLLYEEMIKAGLIYGHRKSKTNPRFRPYIFTTRNGIEIIDLSQTLSALDKATEFLKAKIKNNGRILVVAIQAAAKEGVQKLAAEPGFYSINNHWIGGLLTNFRVISARIEHYKRLKNDFEKGALEKYTKKERVVISREINRMKEMFVGLENLERLPDALLIIDTSIKGHNTALREAKIMKIPIVAVIDSDDNPDLVDYPIPANDHAKVSIEWIVKRLIQNLKHSE